MERIRGKRVCTKKLAENSLVILTALGAIMGIILGFAIRAAQPTDTAVTLIMFPGELFMRMLKMLIIPVIITSIVTGLVALDVNKSGKIGLHAVAYYLTTSILATVLGIVLVVAIHPGRPESTPDDSTTGKTVDVSILDSFLDLFRNLLPENIVAACFEFSRTEKVYVNSAKLASNFTDENQTISTIDRNELSKRLNYVRGTNILGLISFFIVFGVTLSGFGEELQAVTSVFSGINKVLMKMIEVGIWLSPIGICSLIAGNILGVKSLDLIIHTIGMYMVTVMLAKLIHGLIVLPLIFWIMTRQNPYKYALGVSQALLTAFGTTSSAATLPVTTKNLENNLNIDRRITRFLLPIGATVNMDASALMQAVAVITVAQMYRVPLSFGKLVTISLTATAVSIGSAAIPGADMAAFLLVLSTFGLPTEIVGVFWSIDWFLGRIRAVVNVFGDCIGAGIIQHINKSNLQRSQQVNKGDDADDEAIEETSLVARCNQIET